MRIALALMALVCGAAVIAFADDAPSAWCEGKDKLTIENNHFYLNGKQLPDKSVEDATEEDGVVAFEYDERLFMPCP